MTTPSTLLNVLKNGSVKQGNIDDRTFHPYIIINHSKDFSEWFLSTFSCKLSTISVLILPKYFLQTLEATAYIIGRMPRFATYFYRHPVNNVAGTILNNQPSRFMILGLIGLYFSSEYKSIPHTENTGNNKPFLC